MLTFSNNEIEKTSAIAYRTDLTSQRIAVVQKPQCLLFGKLANIGISQ